ncbi:MAG TPA: methyltransferase domain-containing protein [Bacteroidales bacterium]|nr:methyltransferase domain-containing protein [Bacteroidales bacterium]
MFKLKLPKNLYNLPVIILCTGICYGQENPYRVLEIIGLEEGMVVGEVGAGEGYYSFLMSDFVGLSGHIYANEIKPELIRKIRNYCKREDIQNVTVVKGKTTDAKFPVNNLDIVFMRHVLHCMKKPDIWMRCLDKYIKHGGFLVIIDGDPDVVRYGWDYLIRKEEVIKMTEDAGFKLTRIEDCLLPEDYIYIFQRLSKN